MNKRSIFAFVVAALLPFTAYTRPQSPAPSEPTQLALEITFLKGQPPSLYPVARQQAKKSGGWSLRFSRVTGWQPTAGLLPVRAVQVVSQLEGTDIKVQVSVLSGQSMEHEEPVLTFDLNEGKQRVIGELTKFGIEPIEIKAVRITPRRTIVPQIVNKTESIVATGITVGVSTLPSYQLALQNASTRDVMALEVNIVLSGKKEILMLPQGQEGRALIAAGSPYNLAVRGDYQVRSWYGDHPPDFSREHDCVILAAVFRDGSYEGEAISASRFMATSKGQQLQLPGVVALLQEALTATDDVGATLQRLRTGISALKTQVGESEVKALLNKFPTLATNEKTALLPAMQEGRNRIKNTFGEELNKFEKTQAVLDQAVLRTWLLASKARYEQWLARL